MKTRIFRIKSIVGCIISCVLLLSVAASAFAVREEGFLELDNGNRLHYISKGKKGAPLVLFIHGAPERAEVWEEYLSYFGHYYYSVAYTSRGYFPSSIPQGVEEYTTDKLAEDAVAVAAKLGYDSFTLVGHDWGASTVWQVAIRFPEKVERMVTMATPHPIVYTRGYHESEAHAAALDGYIPLIRNGLVPWTVEGVLSDNVAFFKEYVYSERSLNRVPWALGIDLEETWRFNDGESLEALFNHYRALNWPLAYIPNCSVIPDPNYVIKQPVLMVYGEKDRFVSSEVYDLPNNDCTPNIQYLSYPKGGHFIQHEYKWSIMAQMKAFFEETQQ
ncbi:alpha/beta fold hydrolase [Marinibactrum halimedae]|uniref:Epoxide hydrolase n=1 Tax=Marinibactrum halimedae TaxID=1444977 RepID=A0AA37T6Y7_9GAMM|nr:alpha/beta hydrolase [Marinibactrum halimedae]MCD9457805.1 alpha/beta hydrolase [Marinibactrum halimedae]GLS24821.1 epoxide hydrolase [Marinibactrum halimedae]